MAAAVAAPAALRPRVSRARMAASAIRSRWADLLAGAPEVPAATAAPARPHRRPRPTTIRAAAPTAAPAALQSASFGFCTRGSTRPTEPSARHRLWGPTELATRFIEHRDDHE